jgi:hypothetical protein
VKFKTGEEPLPCNPQPHQTYLFFLFSLFARKILFHQVGAESVASSLGNPKVDCRDARGANGVDNDGTGTVEFRIKDEEAGII